MYEKDIKKVLTTILCLMLVWIFLAIRFTPVDITSLPSKGKSVGVVDSKNNETVSTILETFGKSHLKNDKSGFPLSTDKNVSGYGDTAVITKKYVPLIDSNFIPNFKSENGEIQSAFVVMGTTGQSVYALGDDWLDLHSNTGGILIMTRDQINFPIYTTGGYTIDSSKRNIDSLFIKGFVVTESKETYMIKIVGKNMYTLSDRIFNQKRYPYDHAVIQLGENFDFPTLFGSPVFNNDKKVVGILTKIDDLDPTKIIITLF